MAEVSKKNMSITKPPSEARQGRSSNDVDGVLRDFFRSSMPDPWPACPRPSQSILPMQRVSAWKQRIRPVLALAASLLLIALGAGIVSGRFSTQSSGLLKGDSISNRDPEQTPHGQPRRHD
jgi:hypothetical protein